MLHQVLMIRIQSTITGSGLWLRVPLISTFNRHIRHTFMQQPMTEKKTQLTHLVSLARARWVS